MSISSGWALGSTWAALAMRPAWAIADCYDRISNGHDVWAGQRYGGGILGDGLVIESRPVCLLVVGSPLWSS
jgi:hypothetical protein